MVRRGNAWTGRHGRVRPGTAWSAEVRQGEAGPAGLGKEWTGGDRLGPARQAT